MKVRSMALRKNNFGIAFMVPPLVVVRADGYS
jgi:hypothetical protein